MRRLISAALAALLILPPHASAMGRRPEAKTKNIPGNHILHKSPIIQPLTIEECYELAIKRSEVIAIRDEDIEATKADFLKALGEAVGDVDFEMTDFFQEEERSGGGADSGSVGTSISAPHRKERRFIITQPVFQGFRSLGALAGAGSLKRQREQEKLRAEQLLLRDVADAFYTVLLFQKDIETLEEIRQLFGERMTELQERVDIGRSRRTETVTTESRLKSLDSSLARSRGSYAVSKHLLEFLIGFAVEANELKESDIPEAPEDLSTYLLKADERADVAAAEAAVKTAKSKIVIAQSDIWPDISIENSRYTEREGFQKEIDWDLLFKVNVPIFRGGSAFGNVKTAFTDWRKAKLNHSLVLRRAQMEIQQSYQEWVTSLNQTKALTEAVAAAEENFKLQKEDYDRNLVNNLDVLDALETLQQSRRELLLAHYQMKENYWSLKAAAGEIPGEIA